MESKSIPNQVPTAVPALTEKDFRSDQDVRWCPGVAIIPCLPKPSVFTRTGYSPREFCFYLWDRLFKPFSVLYEYVWISYHPRSSADNCRRQ